MFRLTVEDTFRIRGRGVVATGRVDAGAVSVGDTVLANTALARGVALVVKGVEIHRKVVDSASEGDEVGLLFDDAVADAVTPGAVITGDGVAPSAPAGPSVSDMETAQRDIGLGEPPRRRRWFGRG
jgi:elongation factor Tu